jgi:hypothetical protein
MRRYATQNYEWRHPYRVLKYPATVKGREATPQAAESKDLIDVQKLVAIKDRQAKVS